MDRRICSREIDAGGVSAHLDEKKSAHDPQVAVDHVATTLGTHDRIRWRGVCLSSQSKGCSFSELSCIAGTGKLVMSAMKARMGAAKEGLMKPWSLTR